MLDFLVCYPYLSKNAIIIVDDLTFAHGSENRSAFSTRILQASLVADKLYSDSEYTDKMSGMRLNKNTDEFINNVFCSLMIPWNYLLDEFESDYESIIRKKYGDIQIQAFLSALTLNRSTIEKDSKKNTIISDLLQYAGDNNIYIYGAGQRGKALRFFLESQGKHVESFIVSDDRITESGNENALTLAEVQKDNDRCIIVAAAANSMIISNLQKNREDYYIPPNTIYSFLKQYYEILK